MSNSELVENLKKYTPTALAKALGYEALETIHEALCAWYLLESKTFNEDDINTVIMTAKKLADNHKEEDVSYYVSGITALISENIYTLEDIVKLDQDVLMSALDLYRR